MVSAFTAWIKDYHATTKEGLNTLWILFCICCGLIVCVPVLLIYFVFTIIPYAIGRVIK